MLHTLVKSSMVRFALMVAGILGLLTVGIPYATAQQPPVQVGTYTNPLPITDPETGRMVETCADPSVIKGQEDDAYWYMYCTTDPLNDEDKAPGGGFNFRLIPTFRSLNLVDWEYVNDAFLRPDDPRLNEDPERGMPDWTAPTAGFWAPEIDYFDGMYYLYYGVTDVTDETSGEPGCGFDPAVGVATSESPVGPWTNRGPVIYPRRAGGGCEFLHFFDADVFEAQDGNKYIYYGSYRGGIFVSRLSEDGFTVVEGTERRVAIANRYEGAEVVYKDGYYYLFVSATNCCNGPITGYSVFVGRSRSPVGPFVDRDGVYLDPEQDQRLPQPNGEVGGTPVLTMNGNRWVGPGHNTVFQDFAGQWWTIYHAIDVNDPYFASAPGFTKRPALLDPLTWMDGWPTVRGGRWASDEAQAAPAAQPGQKSEIKVRTPVEDRLGKQLYAEEFTDNTLGEWGWKRQPDTATYGVEAGNFRFDTQRADLFVDSNNASVLLLNNRLAGLNRKGNWVVETRVKMTIPRGGCCYNYRQAGLVIYGDDDNFIKLVHFAAWETRQTEFAKEEFPVPAGFTRYGNTVVGPPAEWTLLRIVKRTVGDQEYYTAYTRQDVPEREWVRGGTWTHKLGSAARIGLVSMGGGGPLDSADPSTALFDYVRVNALNNETYLPLVFK